MFGGSGTNSSSVCSSASPGDLNVSGPPNQILNLTLNHFYPENLPAKRVGSVSGQRTGPFAQKVA